MNTSGYVMQGSPNPDGHIFIPISPASVVAGAATRSSSGPGIVTTVVPASTTTTFAISLSELLFRYGMQDDSQMLFGRANGTSGANAQALTPGVVDQTPYSRNARPPIPSGSVFGSGGNAIAIPKGISLKAISAVYQPVGGVLGGINLSLTKTQFSIATGPAVTVMLPVTSVNQAGAAGTNIVTTTLPLASQIMLTSRFAQYIIQLTAATGAGVSCNFFGIFLDVAYNFN